MESSEDVTSLNKSNGADKKIEANVGADGDVIEKTTFSSSSHVESDSHVENTDGLEKVTKMTSSNFEISQNHAEGEDPKKPEDAVVDVGMSVADFAKYISTVPPATQEELEKYYLDFLDDED